MVPEGGSKTSLQPLTLLIVLDFPLSATHIPTHNLL